MTETVFQFAGANWPMLVAIAAFLFAVVAMVTEIVDKTLAVLIGALVIGFSGAAKFEDMIGMIDFTTIILLLGLMLLVEVTQQSKVLEWLNVHIVKKTKGNPLLLFLVFSMLTMVLSTFLANATTMMILVPLTVAVTRGMGIDPKPYVISEIIFSDIGGALTIIGDPANVLIASATDMQFMAFSKVMIIPLSFILVAYIAILTVVYWQEVKPIASSLTKLFMTNMLVGRMEHQFRKSFFNVVFARRAVIVFGFVIFAMISNIFHMPIEYIALGGAILLVLTTQKYVNLHKVFEAVDVHTLLFFAGLFIIVGTLDSTGALRYISDFITTHATTTLGVSLLVLWTVGLLSAFVENIPLVAMMIPVLQNTIESGVVSGNTSMLWFALSLGACLGGNGSLIGSSANILGAQLSTKNGVPLSFMEYFKIGYPLTILSLVISSVFLWFAA